MKYTIMFHVGLGKLYLLSDFMYRTDSTCTSVHLRSDSHVSVYSGVVRAFREQSILWHSMLVRAVLVLRQHRCVACDAGAHAAVHYISHTHEELYMVHVPCTKA